MFFKTGRYKKFENPIKGIHLMVTVITSIAP